jgi:hypothetical protein
VEVGLELERGEPVEHGAAGGDPADAEAAAERLAQRRDVDRVRGGEAAKRGLGFAVVAELAVYAVLDEEEVALAREAGEALAALG